MTKHVHRPHRSSRALVQHRDARSHLARAARRAMPPIEMLETRRLLAVTWDFTIIDADNTYAQWHDEILGVMNRAGEIWSQYFDADASIEVDLSFSNGNGYLAAAFPIHFEKVAQEGPVGVYEVGPLNEIKTEVDPNGAEADASVDWNADFLATGEISTNYDDARVVPANQYDALTIALHELGHVIGFYGMLDDLFIVPVPIPWLNNEVAITTFDQHVQPTGDGAIFVGTQTDEVFGDIPLAFLSISHYGDPTDTEGPGLYIDGLLMSPSIGTGERIGVGEIDLAILADLGMPLSSAANIIPPTPASPVLNISGTGGYDTIGLVYTGARIFVTFNSRPVQEFMAPDFVSYVINGGLGDDLITLSPEMPPTTIYGSAGNDTIVGSNANDTIYGGAGHDDIRGGRGQDVISGNGGHDRISGDEGVDLLYGGDGNDTIDGGAQGDRISGNDGDDVLLGNSGDDTLYGGGGNDLFDGGGGDDFMIGHGGADEYRGGRGWDMVSYEERTDDLLLSLNGIADDGIAGEGDNLATSIELLVAGAGNDKISGDGKDNYLDGGAGHDCIDGGSGDDLIFGGSGNDKIQGQSGSDEIYGETGNDSIVGGGQWDYIEGGSGRDFFISIDRWSDTIVGGAGQDLLWTDEYDSHSTVEAVELTTIGL